MDPACFAVTVQAVTGNLSISWHTSDPGSTASCCWSNSPISDHRVPQHATSQSSNHCKLDWNKNGFWSLEISIWTHLAWNAWSNCDVLSKPSHTINVCDAAPCGIDATNYKPVLTINEGLVLVAPHIYSISTVLWGLWRQDPSWAVFVLTEAPEEIMSRSGPALSCCRQLISSHIVSACVGISSETSGLHILHVSLLPYTWLKILGRHEALQRPDNATFMWSSALHLNHQDAADGNYGPSPISCGYVFVETPPRKNNTYTQQREPRKKKKERAKRSNQQDHRDIESAQLMLENKAPSFRLVGRFPDFAFCFPQQHCVPVSTPLYPLNLTK